MTELLTATEMRALEQAAITTGQVTGLELMERAGQGVVDAMLAEWPSLAAPDQRAIVLCGPGNNGGDGCVVARLLKNAGWAVDVFAFGVPKNLPPDARANYALWTKDNGITHLGFPEAETSAVEVFCNQASHRPDIIQHPLIEDHPPFVLIDALFGTGLARPITGLDVICDHWDYLSTFRDLNNCHLVAIDIPSGLSSDTGEAVAQNAPTSYPFSVLVADLTVTFHSKKIGHIKGIRLAVCGKVVVADIGLQSI